MSEPEVKSTRGSPLGTYALAALAEGHVRKWQKAYEAWEKLNRLHYNDLDWSDNNRPPSLSRIFPNGSGIRYLDSGAYRTAFADTASRIVYKVATYSEDKDHNEREFEAATEMRKKGIPGVPPVTLWYVKDIPVVAMPFYPYDAATVDKKVRDATKHFIQRWREWGMSDLHDGNYRYSKTMRLRITDLAGW